MSKGIAEPVADRRALVTGKIVLSFAAIYTTEYAGFGWAKDEHKNGPRLDAAFQRVREQMSVAADSAALGAVKALEEAASSAYGAKSTLGGGLVRVTVMNWLRNRAASYTKEEASHGTE